MRSSRIEAQAVSRASLAWTSPTRARTSSDFTAGTETPSAPARSADGIPPSSRISSAERCCSQALYVGDQPSERLTLLDAGMRVEHRPSGAPFAELLDRLDGERGGAAQLVDAPVVRDAVQPRAQGEVAPVGPQARVGAHEDLLDGVLGVGGARGEHLTRVGEHPRAVAVVDDPEGILAAGAEQGHELVVGTQAQQRRAEPEPCARQTNGCWESGGFHEGSTEL